MGNKYFKEYMKKGFVLDDECLKNLGRGNYFNELLAKIRDIRSSEKVFWRFLFESLDLKSSLREIDIDDSNFDIIAKKACGGEILICYKPLNQDDIITILNMCL